jgi:hypothetical protein
MPVITRSRSKISKQMEIIPLRTKIINEINNLDKDLMITCITDFEEGTKYFFQFEIGCCDNSEINEISENYTGIYEYIGRSQKRFEKHVLLFKNAINEIIEIDKVSYLHTTYYNVTYNFICYNELIDFCCSNGENEFIRCNIFKQRVESETEFVLK